VRCAAATTDPNPRVPASPGARERPQARPLSLPGW
jgi:hypothetical protein